MKNIIRATAIAATCALAPATLADGAFDEGRWYISPMATWVFDEDSDRATNDGYGGRLGLGRGFGDNWAVELGLFGNQLDGYAEVNQWGLGLDFIHSLNDTGAWHPYWSIGIGYMKSNTVPPASCCAGVPLSLIQDYENPYASVGAGIMREFGDNGLMFRSDVRLRGDFADPSAYRDFLWNIGFVRHFGPPPAPPVVDSDGDGVPDGMDRCPGTPPGTAVDNRGCELDSDGDGVVNSKDACPDTRAGARVDERGCEVARDSDGDGVTDDRDRCPNTPRGTKVDEFGCRVIGDADGDGVLDNRDRCPDTREGARVDVNGCEFTEEIRLPGVNFELNSAQLTAGSLSVLNDAAATLQKYPKLVVEAEGHTDSSGAADYNQGLSQRRAEAVRDYLIQRGANAANITAKGYGESQPVADNATAAGRAQNRRVTLRILSQ